MFCFITHIKKNIYIYIIYIYITIPIIKRSIFPHKSKLSDISCFVLYNCMHYYYYYTASLLLYLTLVRIYIASEIYSVNYGTRFDNATQIRTSDAQQCQTISAIVAIIVLIIAFTITPASTIVTPSKQHKYIVIKSQYNDATTPILFSDSTTLSTTTVEMNNAWKRGEKESPYRDLIQKKDKRSMDSM